LGAQIRAERIHATIFHVWKHRMLFRYPAGLFSCLPTQSSALFSHFNLSNCRKSLHECNRLFS